jgi:hypothetical protein
MFLRNHDIAMDSWAIEEVKRACRASIDIKWVLLNAA